MINCFKQINWVDPFPDEKMPSVTCRCVIPEKFDDIIYKKGQGRNPKKSPNIIYIPSAFIMLKMMRACINAHHNGELWLYGGLSHE